MLLLKNATVVTVDEARSVIDSGAIVVDQDRIVGIYDLNDAQQLQTVNELCNRCEQVIDCSNRLIIPGLINTHVHSVQQLGRGLGDDVHLITWLHDRIWPYESHMNDRDVYISTKLMILEQIRSGVTCWADAGGHHMDQIAKAVEEMGVRAVLSESTMDEGTGLPQNWVKSTEACIESQLNNINKYHKSCEGRVRYWFNLRTIFNCSNELVKLTKQHADRLGVGIHMHVAEIKEEVDFCKEHKGDTTVKHLEKLGALGPNLLAVHSVWLDREELELFEKRDVKVSHCPAAAMRYLGFAKVPEMLDRNISVSIGTDGAPSNNRMTLLDDAWLANLIHKGRTLNPIVCPSRAVLEMISRNAARCLLWDDEIGSLEVNKKADLVIINPNSANMLPLHDPISNLITCMQATNVESVMVNGKFVMRNGQIEGEESILQEAKQRASEIVKRANIQL